MHLYHYPPYIHNSAHFLNRSLHRLSWAAYPIGPFIMGLAASMEEQNANSEEGEFQTESISMKAYNPKLYDFCMEELGEKNLLSWIEKNYRRGYKQIA